MFRLVLEHDVDADRIVVSLFGAGIAFCIDVADLPAPGYAGMLVDIKGILVHDGRGRTAAFCFENVVLIVRFDGICGMLFYFRKEKRFPIVKVFEILAEERISAVSAEGSRGHDCRKQRQHDEQQVLKKYDHDCRYHFTSFAGDTPAR